MSGSETAAPSAGGGTATASSANVLDHRFGRSAPFTVGVEEEYMLLDPASLDLVQDVEAVMDDLRGDPLAARVVPELMQSVVEVSTPVCRSAAEAGHELRRLRGTVCRVAGARGLRVGSAGTHPFSLFERQRITAKDRYRELVDRMQYVVRRELIFGTHVHVAVDDPDKAIQVVNGLLPHLGPLLALSTSSPFWRGEPTGLASSRQMVFSASPRSGSPPRFRDYAEYAEVVGELVRTGCIGDATHIWWHVRPHPRWGTVEIRVCDALTRLDDTVAITAYCQSAVKMLSDRVDAGETVPSYHRILTSENTWLAARHGLGATPIDLGLGRSHRVPVTQLIRRALRDLAPHARELGCDRELEGVREILERGTSADRQLRVWNANHDLREVVADIADTTATGCVLRE